MPILRTRQMRTVNNRIRLPVRDLHGQESIDVPDTLSVIHAVPKSPREIRLHAQGRQVVG
jgi:hypothetical protein